MCNFSSSLVVVNYSISLRLSMLPRWFQAWACCFDLSSCYDGKMKISGSDLKVGMIRK